MNVGSVFMAGAFKGGRPGTTSVCEELAVQLEERQWSIIRAPWRAAALPRVAAMVASAWSQRRNYEVAQVDVFSGRGFMVAEALCRAIKVAGRPIVLTLHGGALPDFARRWPRRVRALLSAASAITAPSSYLAENLRTVSPFPIRIIPNGIDVGLYSRRVRTLPKPALVWLRAFHGIYNPEMAVEVLQSLHRTHPDATLRMIGPDKQDLSLQRTAALVESCRLSGTVTLVGPVQKTQVPAELTRGDIFLNTALVDNAPVTVLEAMAEGLCVISTRAGGVPAIVKDGHNGLLVEPRDTDGAARAVERVLSEPGLAERLSQGGIAEASRCDWPVVMNDWERLLRSVCTTRRAGECAS